MVETREFAQKQLAAFRAYEEERQNASRRIRNGLRNIEALIADVPVARELALDVKERAPTEEVLHLKLANTALHAKVLEITELLEVCIKSENNMRRRMESAEQRAAAAEDRVIDLQAQLFEANLRSAAAASPHNRAARRF